MRQREFRTFTVGEIRAAEQDGKTIHTVTGYAAVFNQLSEDLGGFRERIAPGAFADSIKTDDIRALINHDPSQLLGRNRADTLRLSEDDHGLAVEIDFPDTQIARDLATSMERGDSDQMSFGFFTAVDGDTWTDIDGEPIRTLLKAELFDVSIVTYPAYPQTQASLNSLIGADIDSGTLAGAAIRAAHGLELTDEHRQTLTDFTGHINGLITTEAQPDPLIRAEGDPEDPLIHTDLHNPNDYELDRRKRIYTTHGRSLE